ncbi:MAG: DUF1501 domain-containing protein [Gemmataceae bacterium]
MLSIGKTTTRTCQGMTRREILQVGGLGFLGLTLADWFGARTAAQTTASSRDPACIFIFLSGGPSHFETFDPKPAAPVDIRGPYGTIPTSASGIRISELLPQIAEHMDKCALVRSMTSRAGDHSGTFMVSGGHRSNASIGAVLQQMKGATRTGVPPFVHVGAPGYLPGGGTLGTTYNPLLVADPSRTVSLPEFTLNAAVTPSRFGDRRELLRAVDGVRAAMRDNPSVNDMDANYQRAVDLLTSDRIRSAFDVGLEDERIRRRYGGSIFGQSCLLARRLVEAGSRFIQVNWYGEPAWHGWDVHGADLPGLVRMESPLCPRLDQSLSALLDDLHRRGLLSSTLVVVTGEFGRTPRINQYGGRDHWPQCFSVLLAGCGVPGGTVIGASDNHGALPAVRPVSVPELAATVYRLMGINTNTDLRIRPFIGDAAPLPEVI